MIILYELLFALSYIAIMVLIVVGMWGEVIHDTPCR